MSEDPASGPSFWGLNYGPQAPSFVGIRSRAPAPRAAMVWRHDLPADAVTPDFLVLFDCAVNWLTSNRTSRVVLFSPPPAGTGDDALVNRLLANGFTVVPDNTAEAVPLADTIALVIQSSSGVSDPTRFTIYTAPLLSFNASNHDDELTSSIGTTLVTDLGMVRPNTATNHPARCGLTNSFIAVTGAQNFDLIGPSLPAAAVTIASFDLVTARTATTLADVDAMIAGTFESAKMTGMVAVADFAIGEGALYTGLPQYDQPVPGDPTTVATFGTRATFKIQVSAPGTWTFALPVDDGARLRIDRNRNGFDPSDNVFNAEAGTGLRVLSNDVAFAETGMYDVEWVTLATGGNYGQEIAVAVSPGAGTVVDPFDPANFELIGEHNIASQLKLSGQITVVAYVPTAVLTQTRPFLIVVKTGDSLLGGPLTGFEGSGFWGGADLNDVDYGTPSTDAVGRLLTLQSVNVSNQTNVQLTLGLAGSDVDFESNDFLKIYADVDGSGPQDFQVLAEFRGIGGGPMGDALTNGTPSRYVLRGIFRDVTYPIPGGATDLVIRFEAHSTFFNEVVAFDNVRITVAGAAPPTISIRRVGVDVIVTFTGTLRSSPTVNGTYTDVPGATSPFVIAPANQGTQRFYRAGNP